MFNIEFHDNFISTEDNSQEVIFIIPVFNDWKSVRKLLEDLDTLLTRYKILASILVVDDASNFPEEQRLFDNMGLRAIKNFKILRLKRNIGHQRAITIGLAYTEAFYSGDMVLVMDADGEDTPQDCIALIQKCVENDYRKIIFARRSQRSESFLFKLFYRAYYTTYHLLTGFDIRVGNFSIIPFNLLHRLVVVSELWNHYAAGVLKSKLMNDDINTRRGTRYYGKSQMNFTSLITHGLSAISVHGEIVGVRLLIVSCMMICLMIIAILIVVGIRLTTNLAIPGWTSYIVTILLSLILQVFMIALSFIFLVLVGRNNIGFIPSRDYSYFILSVEDIF
ncbi:MULTISPECIES: glycosyltransferase [unclassified Synechocystis]|uniref:glycosyltransferase n=1 Tax=unclassified Synechocystis TaxID=2640012 RepID=UPI00040C6CDA|nr:MULTISPECIES: glycosyltransferase [unclassified Synechocystis]AIE73104.1 hypothetical protein D082_05750 [Synechocystis sp. PCC 6714]MCT0254373.1 glycosyltransferase [Synechocystis sp. CS-94]